MAQLRPFKGIRYNQDKSGDLTKNVCPPFDSISDTLRKKLYEISEYNTVRLELGSRGMDEDPYFSAAEIQNSWIKQGVLVQDDSPSIYVTEEEFKFGDQVITRKGFICALKVEKYESKVVIPHEKTREKWVEDRQKLMEIAKSNYSPLLCLYEDDSRETIANLVKSISGKVPYIDIAPDELQKIKVWRVTDQGTISLITKNFNNSKIFIADGHHRYEAGLRYISKINKYREIDDNEILHRLSWALLNTGCMILEEGFALRASDIDVTYAYGYGYPHWRGGPMKYAQDYGLKKVLEDIESFRKNNSDMWPKCSYLEELVKNNKTFS